MGKMLENAIGAMLAVGDITYAPSCWCFGVVNVTIHSKVFVDKAFDLSIKQEDWDAGQSLAVASYLSRELMKGTVQFIPYFKKV